MSDILDKPLNMPPYPSHAVGPAPATEPHGPLGLGVEIDGESGCVLNESLLSVPTERLDETAEHKAAVRQDTLLTIVANWYGSYLMGRPTVLDHNAGDTNRHRTMKVLLADAKVLLDLIEADGTTPRTPPTTPASATVAVNGGPHSAESLKVVTLPVFDSLPADQRTYFTWLARFGWDGVPPSAHCPDIGPEQSSVVRRMLEKAGLVESCPWEDTHGFRVSDAGLMVLEKKRRESREIAA